MRQTDRQARQYNVMKVNVVESANSCAYFAKTGMHTAQVQSVQASSSASATKVHRLSLHCGQTVPCWWFNCSEGGQRDSPAGGTERERGCWDCLLDNCSQFAGVLQRNTRTFTSLGGGWNVGRVSKWSAVETCTFVLLCGVIVVAAVAAGGCSTGDRC